MYACTYQHLSPKLGLLTQTMRSAVTSRPHTQCTAHAVHLPTAHCWSCSPCGDRSLTPSLAALAAQVPELFWFLVLFATIFASYAPDPTHGALPHRAPCTRCTAGPMHHVWHRYALAFNMAFGADIAEFRSFHVSSRPHTQRTAPPCTFPRCTAEDPVHRVWLHQQVSVLTLVNVMLGVIDFDTLWKYNRFLGIFSADFLSVTVCYRVWHRYNRFLGIFLFWTFTIVIFLVLLSCFVAIRPTHRALPTPCTSPRRTADPAHCVCHRWLHVLPYMAGRHHHGRVRRGQR